MKCPAVSLGVCQMADACGHIETTAEHLAAMLNSPDVDVVIALWRDPDAPGGLEGPESLRRFNPIPKHKSGKARIEAPSVNGKAHRPHTEALGSSAQMRCVSC